MVTTQLALPDVALVDVVPAAVAVELALVGDEAQSATKAAPAAISAHCCYDGATLSIEEPTMRFNPLGLAVFVLICLLLAAAVSSGGGWMHAAEAVTSVLILLSVIGMFRGRRRIG